MAGWPLSIGNRRATAIACDSKPSKKNLKSIIKGFLNDTSPHPGHQAPPLLLSKSPPAPAPADPPAPPGLKHDFRSQSRLHNCIPLLGLKQVTLSKPHHCFVFKKQDHDYHLSRSKPARYLWDTGVAFLREVGASIGRRSGWAWMTTHLPFDKWDNL